MSTRTAQQPNILIVVIDSLRADHVSAYGYHRQTTPNIDRLAAEGCLFDTAITAAPFSPASYASIFSNLYPHQHGVNGDTVRVWPDTWPRLPELMRSHGYYTFGVSNNSFVSPAMNGTRGFDAFRGPHSPWPLRQYSRLTSRIRRYVGEDACRLINANRILCMNKGDSRAAVNAAKSFIRAGRRPFFGFVILMDPHALYNPRRRDFCTDPKHTRAFLKHINGWNMWTRMMAHRQTLSPDQLQAAIDLYDSEILHADRCLGELRDWLQTVGLLDDTILAVASDHGEAFGEHGVWGHGFCLNDCLTRVPLVLRCPRYWPPGTRSKALIQLHDLHDLCVSVAATGRPTPDQHPHCLTQAADPTWPARDVTFSEFPVQTRTLESFRQLESDLVAGTWRQELSAVRSREWRYIEHDQDTYELYDLRSDSDETASVSNGHATVCAEYRARLRHHRKTARSDPSTATLTDDTLEASVLERLRSLGYVE